MRVLVLGGTGNISSACVDRVLARGYDVTILVRGTQIEHVDPRVHVVRGDRHDATLLQHLALEGTYDVVANFLGFTPEEVQLDIDAFAGRIGQYVFVSTASAYERPPSCYLITEATRLHNPYWEYARLKIACEELLARQRASCGFPYTVVRPSYTYGPTWIPCSIGGHGYTVVHRMRQGLPVVVQGDGQSLWVMTHASDLAKGVVGLFGVQEAIGEAFHITSDEVLTWDAIYRAIAEAAGCPSVELVHVPTDTIASVFPELGPGLLGDKGYSVVFDNSKIKRFVPGYKATVPFREGIARSIEWHDADTSRRGVNQRINAMMDELVRRQREAMRPATP